MLVAEEESAIWVQVLQALFARLVPDCRLETRAWPLTRMGKFKEYSAIANKITVWRCSPDMSDGLASHVVRKPRLRGRDGLVGEIQGLGQLRSWLRRHEVRRPPRRHRWLIPASLRLARVDTGKHVAEFDGGVLEVRARDGYCKLYLLESKGSASARRAAHELEDKLRVLEVQGRVRRLKRAAFAEVVIE